LDCLKSVTFEEEVYTHFWLHPGSTCKGFMKNRGVVKLCHRRSTILECDGSGNMLWVFSDSVDRLKWVLGLKIDIGHEISILTPSNHCFRVSWAVTVQNGSFWMHGALLGKNGPGCPIVYMVWTRLPRNPGPNMCVSTYLILTRKLKISESVIRKLKIGTYRLVIHDPSRDLWVVKVYPGLCNHQKLTQKIPKSITHRKIRFMS